METDVLESAQFERHNEGLALIEILLDFDAKTLLAILKQVKLTLLQVNNIPQYFMNEGIKIVFRQQVKGHNRSRRLVSLSSFPQGFGGR